LVDDGDSVDFTPLPAAAWPVDPDDSLEHDGDTVNT